MLNHWRFCRRCRKSARRTRQTTLAGCLSAAVTLKVDRLDNTPLIAVDLEMTGLDAGQDQIVSIGWTQLDGGRIQFASNRHLLIRVDRSVGDSAAIHEMTDREVALGVPLDTALEALFEAARGRLWLFHHAALDIRFLQQACRSWAGVMVPLMAIDSLNMEWAVRERRGLPLRHDDLKLNRLRESYNLPGYSAHNALIDACATAELLLAMGQHMDPVESLRLRPHLQYF